MSWTEERLHKLKKLWAEGLPCSLIATRIGGVTRNAVIGKAHRLGLPPRGATGNRSNYARCQTQNYSSTSGLRGAVQRFNAAHGLELDRLPPTREKRVEPPRHPAAGLPLPMPTADDKARVSAKAVKDNECRWPVGDTHDLAMRMDDPIHCGLQKMPGSSYCTGHHARATVPLRSRQPDLPAESNVVTMPAREKVAA